MKILLADDEKILRITVRDSLEDCGHDVLAVSDGAEALDELRKDNFDCVVTDLKMPDVGGEEVLEAARKKGCEVIVITGAGSVSSAVGAMKQGAFDYVEKPFNIEELLLILEKIEKVINLKKEVQALRSELKKNKGFGRITGSSPNLLKALEISRAAANSDAGVLIEGSSGTGKEVFAKAIHEESSRSDKPFVVISCGIMAENLLESELFGHVKGAFTGADFDRQGRFEAAQGGTVFLDDIDDMPLATQVKLLRVLQERTLERIGSTRTIPVDIRVIAATKVNLKKLVREGKFREDLFYRLNIIRLSLPSLKDRLDDIPLLAANFIVKHSGGREYKIKSEVLDKMQRYPWPGNIRELENSILRAISLSDSSSQFLSERHLLSGQGRSSAMIPKVDLSAQNKQKTLAEASAEAEVEAIKSALEKTSGNRTKAAELLGISRKHLWDKIKKLGIENGS